MIKNQSLLSKEECSCVLGVSVATLNRMISKGTLPIVKVGKYTRIEPGELKKYINSGTTQHS